MIIYYEFPGFLTISVRLLNIFADIFLFIFTENCPDHNPSLSNWNPGHQPQRAVIVRRGDLFRLDASATLRSLTIQSGGRHITRCLIFVK